VAQYLNENGYQAEALRGGFDAWKEAGYPTEPK
jgi:rhodanese-related sulfurtransferase